MSKEALITTLRITERKFRGVVGAAARLFPLWGNNVGALRRQCNAEHLQMKFGGAAALGSPYGGAGERSETERAFAVANMRKVP